MESILIITIDLFGTLNGSDQATAISDAPGQSLC
jgi:hypothetical protein